MFVIEFSPPMVGITGTFNTVRLGLKLSRCLNVGDKVVLIDKRRAETMGAAFVESVHVGRLGDMAQLHAAENHNQRGLDREDAPKRLVANMVKRYGPHICNENKYVTVVYLRMSDEDDLF